MKDEGVLTELSPRLGELTRSNSEAIISVASREHTDMAQGVAISSSIHPEPTTHVEVVKYGSGQDALVPLSVPMIDGGPLRALRFLLTVLRHPVSFIRSMWPVGGADRSVILLVMQSLDNSLTSFRKRGRLTTKQGTGKPNPTWIPIGHKVARLFPSQVQGDAGAVGTDVPNQPPTPPPTARTAP